MRDPIFERRVASRLHQLLAVYRDQVTRATDVLAPQLEALRDELRAHGEPVTRDSSPEIEP